MKRIGLGNCPGNENGTVGQIGLLEVEGWFGVVDVIGEES